MNERDKNKEENKVFVLVEEETIIIEKAYTLTMNTRKQEKLVQLISNHGT